MKTLTKKTVATRARTGAAGHSRANRLTAAVQGCRLADRETLAALMPLAAKRCALLGSKGAPLEHAFADALAVLIRAIDQKRGINEAGETLEATAAAIEIALMLENGGDPERVH